METPSVLAHAIVIRKHQTSWLCTQYMGAWYTCRNVVLSHQTLWVMQLLLLQLLI